MTETEVGILGVGNIGTVHLETCRVLDGVTVTCVADAIEGNRKRARKLGVERTYDDYAELLEAESPDVAIVALPPFLHADATTLAAENGCNVFVEKPFARSSEEAREMIDAAEEHGVVLSVDHTIRYQPEIRKMKEEYDSGKIGHVPLCFMSRINNGPFGAPPLTDPVPGWQLDPEATGGGAVFDLGPHLFDVLEWFFGDMEVTSAEMSRQLNLDYEDAATIVLRSGRTGTIATVNCGFYQWEEPPDINMEVRLDGITETIRSEDYMYDNFYLHAGQSAVENVAKRLRGKEPEFFKPTYFYQAHYNALKGFLDAIRAGEEPPVTAQDGLHTIELVEAAYRAAEWDNAEKAAATAGDAR